MTRQELIGPGGAKEVTLLQVLADLASVARNSTAQEIRDILSLPLGVIPRVGGTPVSGTNPLPVAGVFADTNGVPFGDANPLPVEIAQLTVENLAVSFPNSIVSTSNSFSMPMAAGETFTGTWTDVLDFSAITIVAFVDQPSVVGGAVLEWSTDGVTVHSGSQGFTMPANTPLSFTLNPEARYFRFRYTNGATPSSVVRAQTILRYQPIGNPTGLLGQPGGDNGQVVFTAANTKARDVISGQWLPLSQMDGALLVGGQVAVANFPVTQTVTGTVALDAGTLAALESITAVISGTVSIAGTVNIGNFPATQEVTGTVSASIADPVAVTGPLTDVEFRAAPVNTLPPDDLHTTGTLDSLNDAVTVTLPPGASSISVMLTGTFVGTVSWEGSIDGVNWTPQQLRGPSNALNNLALNASTSPTRWRGNIAGMTYFRLRASAWTSGTATVFIHIGTGVGGTFLVTPIPIGAVSSGNSVSALSLEPGATWTGTFEAATHVASMNINAVSDRDGTLSVAYSRDGVLPEDTVTYPVLASIPRNPILAPRSEYVRVSFTNNGVTAATVSVETLYRAAAVQTPLIGVSQPVPGNSLGAVAKAVVEGANSWVPIARTVTSTPMRVDMGSQGRRSVMLRARTFAQATDIIYVGSSNAVSSVNGIELKERESITLDLATGAQVWAVGTRAGGNQLEVAEIWDS